MAETTPQDVVKQYVKYATKAAFKKLVKQQADKVKSWRCASGPMLPSSLYTELESEEKDEWLDAATPHCSHLGLDSKGRIVSSYRGEKKKPTSARLHTANGFFLFRPDRFGQDTLTDVTWFELDADTIVREISINNFETAVSSPVFQKGRIVKDVTLSWKTVTTKNAKNADLSLLDEDPCSRSEHVYSSDSTGEVSKVVWLRYYDIKKKKPSMSEVVFERKPEKQRPLSEVLGLLEKQMVKEIVDATRAAKISERCVSLIVQFTCTQSDPGGSIPPLYLVTEDLREEFRDEGDIASSWSIPYIEGYAEALTLDSPKLKDLLDEAFSILWSDKNKKGYLPMRTMFRKVCKTLNSQSWNGNLKTTEDFVVVPCDSQDEFEKEEDFVACLGKRAFTRHCECREFLAFVRNARLPVMSRESER